MASVPLSSGASASDLLRSSSNGAAGIPLKLLPGRSMLQTTARRRGCSAVSVVAKIRKFKKHEYPWSDMIGPSDFPKDAHLSYLSHFKPLAEKPKPVSLPFEKPLLDLEKKINDVRKMANETGLDFSDQIEALESKYQQVSVLNWDVGEEALKDLYTHLTPIQRLSIARHPNRPTFLDHVLNITDKWIELHGDRAGYDDPAIVTGIGTIEGRSYMFIGHQKGRNTKENIHRNFGMPTPHGYRKALRMMYYADHHGFPIITFIDTPGAFADIKSEEIGQGEAIAHNLRSMFGLKVPIVSIVIGEGGSGGALAIGCANKLFMLENAVFFVASPEACAAILWKSSKASPKAAEKLKITSTELCKLNIADGVIPEPLGGAHTDPSWTSQQIKIVVVEAVNELLEMDTPKLLNHRMLKFRKIGGFIEGEPVDPAKKVNMKKKDELIHQQEEQPASDLDLELEVEKLKQQILESKEDSLSQPLALDPHGTIEKLKKEVDQEILEAAKSMGLEDRLEMLRQEIKTTGSPNQVMDPNMLEKIVKLKQELQDGLSAYPNFANLRHKIDMLKELSKAQKLSEGNKKITTLKQEINKRLKEVMDNPDVKEKIDMLKEEVVNSGVSKASDLNNELKEKILEVKKEIESELAKGLKSLHLDVELVAPKGGATIPIDVVEETMDSSLKDKIDELNREIQEEIKNAINSTDLKNKMEMLKLVVAKAGNFPDSETKSRVEAMKNEIKQNLAEAINSPSLREKREKLKEEIARAKSSLSDKLEDNGMDQNALVEENLELDTSRV